jgi:hypothetical protein
MVYMRNLNFLPNILPEVFTSINFSSILFSMYTTCRSGIVLEGSLKKGWINAARLLAMAPNVIRVIIFM